MENTGSAGLHTPEAARLLLRIESGSAQDGTLLSFDPNYSEVVSTSSVAPQPHPPVVACVNQATVPLVSTAVMTAVGAVAAPPETAAVQTLPTQAGSAPAMLIAQYEEAAKACAKNSDRNEEREKRPWTDEEDTRLWALVARLGGKKWAAVAREMPGRIGKQCRERFNNNLDPGNRKGKWAPQEDLTIFRKHLEVGNQWAQISAFVPGRTDNSIKNRFHSTMRRYHRYMEAAKQTNPAVVVSNSFTPGLLDLLHAIAANLQVATTLQAVTAVTQQFLVPGGGGSGVCGVDVVLSAAPLAAPAAATTTATTTVAVGVGAPSVVEGKVVMQQVPVQQVACHGVSSGCGAHAVTAVAVVAAAAAAPSAAASLMSYPLHTVQQQQAPVPPSHPLPSTTMTTVLISMPPTATSITTTTATTSSQGAAVTQQAAEPSRTREEIGSAFVTMTTAATSNKKPRLVGSGEDQAGGGSRETPAFPLPLPLPLPFRRDLQACNPGETSGAVITSSGVSAAAAAGGGGGGAEMTPMEATTPDLPEKLAI